MFNLLPGTFYTLHTYIIYIHVQLLVCVSETQHSLPSHRFSRYVLFATITSWQTSNGFLDLSWLIPSHTVISFFSSPLFIPDRRRRRDKKKTKKKNSPNTRQVKKGSTRSTHTLSRPPKRKIKKIIILYTYQSKRCSSPTRLQFDTDPPCSCGAE